MAASTRTNITLSEHASAFDSNALCELDFRVTIQGWLAAERSDAPANAARASKTPPPATPS